MIASVIVDLKVKNVNRPFNYRIPTYFEAIIEKGMRVIVPFGNRELLGFVVDLTTGEESNLKDISELIELTPSLTEELLALAYQMAEQTASFLINCIQAMLPAAIKAKYIKKIKMKQPILELIPFFGKKNEVDFKNIPKEYYALIKKGLLTGSIDMVYEIKDKLAIKYETYVELIQYESIKAKKQQEILDFLTVNQNKVKKSELMKELKLNYTTLKSLETKGLIKETNEELYRDPYNQVTIKTAKHLLNEDQNSAYKTIVDSIQNEAQDIYLLHGVTGSGKTEVYLHVIEDVLNLGKEAILLVPEISLTPQIVSIFKSRFGEQVAVLHSGLSTGEKYDEWRKIHRQEVKVAVGARSAIFAPFTHLGVIIIDEEHESSYKQDEMPKYHAIEIAKCRANFHQATLILGSATPSLESYSRAVKGVYRLLELPKRATNMELPETKIINMTEEYKKGNLSLFSQALIEAIEIRLQKQEQIILLMNRRGYDNFIMCRSCGYTLMCPNCDITLTHHKSSDTLKCHYCGYEQKTIKACPQCKNTYLYGLGYGTQKVEEELLKLFPQVRVIRMDYDTTSNKGDHERLLSLFREKQADILLGTQMIAKGLDFIDVTLVGVLSADTSLKLPDFRASEKTYQLLTQVSGRAGRHKTDSEVIIQTFNPDHYAIVLSKGNHYKTFFKQEMNIRKLGKYVPYYFLAQLVVTDELFQETLKEAHKIVTYLKSQLSEDAILLGPVVPQIKRINNLYSSQVIIKYRKEPQLKATLEQILVTYQDKSVRVVVDLYPNFLM